jgi:hypothetical protein
MLTSNDDGKLIGYSLLGFGAGIYLFFKGFRQFRNYRLIADTPEIPIRSIPMGFVEIHGNAQGGKNVQSPVSHTPCFAYKVVIEKWESRSQGQGSGWKHHRTDVDGVSFHLADAGGKVLVDPRGADLDLPQTARCEAGLGALSSSGVAATQQELLQYVNQADAHFVGGLAERGLKYMKPLADPSKEEKRQALLGAFQHTPGTPDFMRNMMTMMAPRMKQQIETMGPQSDPKKEEARQMALRAFQHPPDSPEFMTAIQKAAAMADEPEMARQFTAMMGGGGPSTPSFFSGASGRFRFTEYCLVPGGTYDISGTCVENPQPQDEYDRNMIVRGTNEKVFLISSKAEKQLESGLRRRAVGMILGGAALSVICLAILLAKFGWL